MIIVGNKNNTTSTAKYSIQRQRHAIDGAEQCQFAKCVVNMILNATGHLPLRNCPST